MHAQNFLFKNKLVVGVCGSNLANFLLEKDYKCKNVIHRSGSTSSEVFSKKVFGEFPSLSPKIIAD